MPRVLLHLAIALALGGLVAWGLWRFMGPVGLVFSAVVFGVLLARPLINLAEELGYAGKEAALKDLQGRNWSHRGNRIDIADDIENSRWLLTADVRKVIPGLPRDEVLARQFDDRAGTVENFIGFRIRADALAEYLLKATDTTSIKFKNWLDREVLGGASKGWRGRSGGEPARELHQRDVK